MKFSSFEIYGYKRSMVKNLHNFHIEDILYLYFSVIQMPDLVQNHSIRETNPSSIITNPLHVNTRSEYIHNSTDVTEKENSCRRHEVEHLIRWSEESYSDLSHGTRIDMLTHYGSQNHYNPKRGKILNVLNFLDYCKG